MGAEDEVGVDTSAADATGAETLALADRYANLCGEFRVELALLGQASMNEMPVVSGTEDYCASVVGQLTVLQAHTGALGEAAQAAAASARSADHEIGTGLGTVFAA